MSELRTLEDIRQYIQKEYWEEGKSKGISGYEKFEISYWWNGRLCQALDQAFGLRGKRFLDLGCAYGQVVAVAYLFGAEAHGIDLSNYAIEQGRLQASWLSNRTYQGSIHDLSVFENDRFDILYSNQVFEHLPGDLCLQLAQETYRVASPGAVLWAGLVLDLENEFINTNGRDFTDPDQSHINVRPKEWWDRHFISAGWLEAPEKDQVFRQTKVEPDGYNYCESYNWHSICYKKGE